MRLLSASILALGLTLGFNAHAGELDNESNVTNEKVALSRDLPATLVVRVNDQTKAVEVLNTQAKLAPEAASAGVVAAQAFSPAQVGAPMAGELDRTSSTSSWYYCYNGWSQPAYYYYYGYSYSYTPYYWYNYGGYSYSYYRWSYGWWY